MQRALIAATAAFSAMLFSQAAVSQPIKIGYAASRTGFLSAGSVLQERSYILWQEQVNAKGGLSIAGGAKRQIELVAYDDQSNAGRNPAIYEKLIEGDKVDLILSPYGTAAHLAVVPTVERIKYPLVGNSAISAKIRDMGGRYAFFPAPAPDNFAEQLVGVLKAAGVKTVTMQTLELPMSLEMRGFTLALLEKAGIKVLSDLRYPPSLKDMTSMLMTAKNAKPDAVLAYTYPDDGDLYLRQSRELGLQAPLEFMMLGPAYPFLIGKYGERLNGVIGVGYWDPNGGNSGSLEFFNAYQKRWNEVPDIITSAIAWVSVQILEQAVTAVGTDREKIRDHIATATFQTIMGPVSFQKQMGSISAGIVQSQNNRTHVVYPASIATKKIVTAPAAK
jgi:branched-chain amino acid transport system substrate-binding protein